MAERSNAAVLGTASCGKTVDPNGPGDFSELYNTYIIRSLKDNGYYFGHCSDLKARIERHNAGKVISTRKRIPFTLHYYETFPTKSLAYKREVFFKTFVGRMWLIQNNIIAERK